MCHPDFQEYLFFQNNYFHLQYFSEVPNDIPTGRLGDLWQLGRLLTQNSITILKKSQIGRFKIVQIMLNLIDIII